jgi:hypothetical protein
MVNGPADQQDQPEQDVPEQDVTEPVVSMATPGDQLRALPDEAQRRGSQFVSAEAMQARLFSVYDAAAAAGDALALVQQQLTLTLDRHYYEAEEIEEMAAQLDALLTLDRLELGDEDLVSEDLVSEDLVSEDLVSED